MSMSGILVVHHYPEGGAYFAWLREPELCDWSFYSVANDDEIQTWIICEMIRKPECRDAAFQWALEQQPVVTLKFMRLIDDIESDCCTLPAQDLVSNA
jgi:hypothetical protein